MWLETVGRSWLSWDRWGQWCLFCSKAGFETAARSIGMFLFEIWGGLLQVEGSGCLFPHPALARATPIPSASVTSQDREGITEVEMYISPLALNVPAGEL